MRKYVEKEEITRLWVEASYDLLGAVQGIGRYFEGDLFILSMTDSRGRTWGDAGPFYIAAPGWEPSSYPLVKFFLIKFLRCIKSKRILVRWFEVNMTSEVDHWTLRPIDFYIRTKRISLDMSRHIKKRVMDIKKRIKKEG